MKRTFTHLVSGFIVVLFLSQLPIPSYSQSIEKAGSQPCIPDSTLRRWVRETRKNHDMPGLAVVIVSSEGILKAEAAGVKHMEKPDSIGLQDRFHIGSNTKAMTSFVAGVLVERGSITWETTIFDIFPEMKADSREDYFDVTLRDLLSHRARIRPFTSGVEMFAFPQVGGSAKEKRKAFTAWLLTQDPVEIGEPGFTYSNAGYAIAASLLEAVSGRTWQDLIKKMIFIPLGLKGGFGWPAAEDSLQPWGHWFSGKVLSPHDPKGEYQIGEFIAPAGDVNLSVLDYGEWLRLNLAGLHGRPEIVSSEMFRFLHYGNLEFSVYSMGWGGRVRDGVHLSAHDGSGGTFYCHANLFMEPDFAFAIMSNCATPKAVEGIHSLGRRIAEFMRENKNKNK